MQHYLRTHLFTIFIYPFTEIVERVKEHSTVPYRPEFPKNDSAVKDEVKDLMIATLEEDPHNRPSFNEIRKQIKLFNKGR